MNNHPAPGQILGMLYGNHVNTLAVIGENIFIFSRCQKREIHLFTYHDYLELLLVSGLMYKSAVYNFEYF